MTKVKAIDFFCGAGGLTRGLLDAGIDVLAGVDNDARLHDTYRRNNKPSRFIHNDINSVEIEALRDELGIGSDDLTLCAACAPCQPFSTLNTMKGADARKSLSRYLSPRTKPLAAHAALWRHLCCGQATLAAGGSLWPGE